MGLSAIIVKSRSVVWLSLLVVTVARIDAYAQQGRETPTSQHEYGTRFFDQLGRIFGRFRDADLRQVFQAARPIQCSDLVMGTGEWRAVAFFNENRKLGDWYRKSIDEVKHDLAVYSFKGSCDRQSERLRVTTKFPVYESIQAYQERRIGFNEIDVNVNAAVAVSFNIKTRAYTFDLPYLFRVPNPNGEPVYTLNPHHVSDRYATDVRNHWECKAVKSDDVTYQFLICRTNLISVDSAGSTGDADSAFGAAAYSILSDGREASATVKLTFEASPDSPEDR